LLKENVFPANTDQNRVNSSKKSPFDYSNQAYYYYYQPQQVFYDQNVINNENNRKLYTTQQSVPNGESLFTLFERYLSDKNNRKRWRELLLE